MTVFDDCEFCQIFPYAKRGAKEKKTNAKRNATKTTLQNHN